MGTTGKPYENLVKVVFEIIVRQKEIHNLVVHHDVILQGKHNNSHQIDVYWKFDVGDLVYETVVQAKDWKTPIGQGELLKFKAVLDDLPGQPKGIVVTRNGYQKGARAFALTHGILIYELREADYPPSLAITAGGWAHYRVIRMPLRGIIVKTGEEAAAQGLYAMGFDVDVYTPEYSNIRFDVAKSWLKSEYPATDTSDLKNFDFPCKFLHEIHLYDQDKAKVGDLASIFQKLGQDATKDGLQQRRATHAFDSDTFMQTDSQLVPYLKVEAVSVDIKIVHKHEMRRGRMSNLAQWVLHDLNSNTSVWFGVAPSVTELLPSKSGGGTADTK